MAQQQRQRFQRGQGSGGGRQQRPVDATTGQQGNTWIGERPSGEDFASWFTDNVKIHDGLSHEDYIGGVVLIEQTGKVKKTVPSEDGSEGAQITEFARLEYTPYAKVDVRMKYLWDLCEHNGNWLGVVEPAIVPRVETAGISNMHLPDGFFRHTVQESQEKWTQFIGCAMRVMIYDRNACRIVEYTDPVTGEPKQRVVGIPIRQAAPATKLVPVLAWEKVDPYVTMKAETGAVGRALGMAGMLVIPGSGIATAEDVQEAVDTPARATSGVVVPAETGEVETSPDALPEVPGEVEPTAGPAEPPADEPPAEEAPPAETQEDLEQASDDRLRELVERDLLALREEAPDDYALLKDWWEKDRKLGELNRASIQGLQQPMLRGVVRKVRRELEEARQKPAEPASAEQAKPEPAEPEPAEPPAEPAE